MACWSPSAIGNGDYRWVFLELVFTKGIPVINYSITYYTKNAVPLFYEDYPGRIVDITQLQCMLEKAKGCQKARFILDRGYFSKENIHYMDKCGYDFMIMMKGMKDLVLEVKRSFEEDRMSIPA